MSNLDLKYQLHLSEEQRKRLNAPLRLTVINAAYLLISVESLTLIRRYALAPNDFRVLICPSPNPEAPRIVMPS